MSSISNLKCTKVLDLKDNSGIDTKCQQYGTAPAIKPGNLSDDIQNDRFENYKSILK